MFLEDCPYTHGPTLDDSDPLETALPACMRTRSGSQLVCLCHLNEGRHSLSDVPSLENLSWEPADWTRYSDIENDFPPPLSSSPPEITSSSPRTAFSDEEGSVKTLTSSRSSPFNPPSLPGRELMKISVQLEKDLEATELEDALDKSSPVYSPRSPHTGSALHFSCGLHTGPFHTNDGLVETDIGWEESESVITQGNLVRLVNVVDLSPITFSSNSEFENLPSPQNIVQSPVYRLIKRARSYKPDSEEPLPKRTKIRYESIPDRTRRVYAPRAASLRRAESLTTISDPESGDLNTDLATPKLEVPLIPLSQRRTTKKVLPYPVPIIAPPENYVGGLPVNAESLAFTRVKKFLEREIDQRAAEGLSTDFLYPGTNIMGSMIDADWVVNCCSLWEGALGIGRNGRLKAISWLLNVKPVVSEAPAHSRSPCSVARSVATSSISSCSSSSSSVTVGSPAYEVHNLLDQLQTSHETRFHACWMFLRYFRLVMSSELFRSPERVSTWPDSSDSYYRSKLEREGLELLVLDISVACLSLSVKFHRDFLDPLLPVYAREYLVLSPHGMSYDDLETAHRDVLSAFRYRLGVSPQCLMDELWFALSSLRELLCFEQGWSRATEHAWSILLRAVCEADVQMFSVSLLSMVAIMEGIIQSLVHRYRHESMKDPLHVRLGGHEPITNGSSSHKATCRDVSEEQARKEAEHVLCEIQALVGVPDAHLQICWLWVEKLEES